MLYQMRIEQSGREYNGLCQALLTKARIILQLKANGHKVGYMGDGINDAPS